MKSATDLSSETLWQIGLATLLVVVLAGFSGCDMSGPDGDDTGLSPGGPESEGTGPGPQGTLTAPILFSLGDGDSILCVGDVITLFGVNFSANLDRNQVRFRSGQTVTQGTPLVVTFPPDNNPRDGLDSRLRVLVPTGVATGSIELIVGGVNAGGRGYLACPQLYGFIIGQGGQPPTDDDGKIFEGFGAIQHNGILGYDPQFGPETIVLQGINFEEVDQVLLRDDQGNREVLTIAGFQRRNLLPNNGLDAILFSLQGIRFGISADRGNIFCKVASANHESNEFMVPQVTEQTFQDPNALWGPSINGVIVPGGVRNGPVRLLYSFADHPITMSYDMDFEWTVDRGETWFQATTAAPGADPLNDGTFKVTPRYNDAVSPFGLIRNGGQMRTFTWDPDHDENFRALNNTVSSNGSPAPRSWTVNFRVNAEPVSDEKLRFNPGILFNFPPIAYFDLEDRTEDDRIASQRSIVFEENFENDSLKVGDCNPSEDAFIDECTTAIWGPGRLTGQFEERPGVQFGLGTLDLVLERKNPPGSVTREFYFIDTSRMQIDRVVVQDVDEFAFPVFPDSLNGVENPGNDVGEFHLRSLFIDDNVDLEGKGNRPLVFKLSGVGSDLDVVFEHRGTIIANGVDGGINDQPGAGGVRVFGSGAGGHGGGFDDEVRGRRGGLDGGFDGETPLAIGFENFFSRVQGGPGGGGGSRMPGGSGDHSAPPKPAIYKPAQPGRGGPSRGERTLARLVPGSGGGGGGLGMERNRTPGNPDPLRGITLTCGGGGGSGGGAVKVSGRGSFIVSGSIHANGGNGADPQRARNGGPGGGGSGGCIFLESMGFVDVSCDSLEVNGGAGGFSLGMNELPAASAGSPGWIRITSRLGGIPFCGDLSVETSLQGRLADTVDLAQTIPVRKTAGFPATGSLVMDDEIIEYAVKTNTAFGELTRGSRGTEIEAHDFGVVVALNAPVFPGEALGGVNSIQLAPEGINTRNGLDEVLHCLFIPSIDPETGGDLADDDGIVLSLWTFDTDTGVVRDPRGAIVKTAIGAATEPGVLQLTRLIIDAGVTLKGLGRHPMQLLVTDTAVIDGQIDVSGEDGGLLVFDSENREFPSPGFGGSGGPGGGAGGPGGTIFFRDGNVNNRDVSNIELVHGAPGELPEALAQTPSPVPSGGPAAATGGDGVRDGSCEGPPNQCVRTHAGGGGGGGHRMGGDPGMSKPRGTRNGNGGDPLGQEILRHGGQLELVAGGGGGGGGPSLPRSQLYLSGGQSPSLFQAAAAYGPGTGGGGGGGVLRLAVGGTLTLRSTARLTANGGSAFQSIDLAGNGGAGGGGTVFVQVANALTIEQGARIEAYGGTTNLPVPVATGQSLPTYEGNLRGNAVFGGLGGDGSSGRVRIEAPLGSNVLKGGSSNTSISGGVTLFDVETSVAFSKPFRLGIGPGGAVLSQDLILGEPVIVAGRFGLPTGTSTTILWQSALENRNRFGEVGHFSEGVGSLSLLESYDFVRFVVIFRSNNRTFEAPVIREIKTNYRKAYLPVGP